MTLPAGIEIPSNEDILRACNAFDKHEIRDNAYEEALSHMTSHWKKPNDMADAIANFLYSWNRRFYNTQGKFNLKKLEKCIDDNIDFLIEFNGRTISSLSDKDNENIRKLFNELNECLQGASGIKSPVSTAKALHLLAPDFFPLWDRKIAKAYGIVYYNGYPDMKYLDFCNYMKTMHEHIKHYKLDPEKSVLKIIDEYNYSKYTKDWV